MQAFIILSRHSPGSMCYYLSFHATDVLEQTLSAGVMYAAPGLESVMITT